MTSIQTLSDADRRTVARWAACCAERVLPLVDGPDEVVVVIREALQRAVAYSLGESTAAEQIRLRMVAMKAAGSAATPAGVAAARSVAHAAAVAHMGAHALGAAAYAAKAAALAQPNEANASDAEVDWQLAQLTGAERAALAQLPLLGTDTSGPLGPGLLTRGVLAAAVRRLQEGIGS